MSLHILSIALISISSNTDSLAAAVAYGIKQVKITTGANLTIAIVSSLGTFLSMSVGEMISGYLSKSTATMLGSGVLIAIGIFGLWQTLEHERDCRKRAKYGRRNIDPIDVHISEDIDNLNYLNKSPTKIGSRSGSIGARQSIPLAFSLTINNIGGGIGGGISGLNPLLTMVTTFILAVLAISFGTTLGKKFATHMNELWAGLLSSGLIMAIGIYEYFV